MNLDSVGNYTPYVFLGTTSLSPYSFYVRALCRPTSGSRAVFSYLTGYSSLGDDPLCRRLDSPGRQESATVHECIQQPVYARDQDQGTPCFRSSDQMALSERTIKF